MWAMVELAIAGLKLRIHSLTARNAACVFSIPVKRGPAVGSRCPSGAPGPLRQRYRKIRSIDPSTLVSSHVYADKAGA